MAEISNQFLKWWAARRQARINRGGGRGFDWPPMRCVSVPTGKNHSTTVVVRGYWIRGWWSPVDKYLALGPIWFRWSEKWNSFSLERNLEPWNGQAVWDVWLPFLHVSYCPEWACRAQNVYAEAKKFART